MTASLPQLQIPYGDAQAWRGQWGYRLALTSSTVIGLELVGPCSSSGVSGGGGQKIPPSAVIAPFDIVNQSSMAADGSATGVFVNTLTSTLFSVYYCNAGAFAGGLGFSQTSFTRNADTQGLPLLGTAGDAFQCMFLGWVFISTTGLMEDSDAARLVVNYFNRRRVRMLKCPGNVDDNADTTYARTLNAWGNLFTTSKGSLMEYIGNGEDVGEFSLHVTLGAVGPAAAVSVGLGSDINTSPEVQASFGAAALARSSVSVRHCSLMPAAGYRTVVAMAFTNNLATTFLADSARNGALADPFATYITGTVMA